MVVLVMYTIIHKKMFCKSLIGLYLFLYAITIHAGDSQEYNLGVTPSVEELSAIDIDIMPDGNGLPTGKGNYQDGQKIYTNKCAACHGVDLQGVKSTGGDALIGGRDTLSSDKPIKTVESFWPYATTLFDYIRRAMPFFTPGSLNDNEVYAVTAYILVEGNIIDKETVLDRTSLPKVKMPNRDGFVPDTRPDL